MTDLGAKTEPASALGRRDFLRLGVGAAVAAAVLSPVDALAMIKAPARQLAMQNLHTGESLKVEYWVKGRYSRDGLRAISRLLRDHRTGRVHPIDPRVLDILFQINRMMGSRGPVHIISGYRSPETNAMLRDASDGVAQNSFHMQGRAIDLRLPGRPLKQLRRAALSLRAGGVGYYPESEFVHVDTGPVRQW